MCILFYYTDIPTFVHADAHSLTRMSVLISTFNQNFQARFLGFHRSWMAFATSVAIVILACPSSSTPPCRVSTNYTAQVIRFITRIIFAFDNEITIGLSRFFKLRTCCLRNRSKYVVEEIVNLSYNCVCFKHLYPNRA